MITLLQAGGANCLPPAIPKKPGQPSGVPALLCKHRFFSYDIRPGAPEAKKLGTPACQINQRLEGITACPNRHFEIIEGTKQEQIAALVLPYLREALEFLAGIQTTGDLVAFLYERGSCSEELVEYLLARGEVEKANTLYNHLMLRVEGERHATIIAQRYSTIAGKYGVAFTKQ